MYTVDDPFVAVNELPDPVTFASGVPEPHCAYTADTRANVAAMMENLAIAAAVFFVAQREVLVCKGAAQQQLSPLFIVSYFSL